MPISASREDGLGIARRRARALLHRCGVREPEHIRVEVFAKRLGAKIVEAPLSGAQSQLIRNGRHIHILVAERVTDEHARRFSIAHELGHLDLEHASCAPVDLARPHPTRRRRSDVRSPESEANTYAAEMLMPEHLVRRACEVSPVSLEPAWQIARTYRVSILAAAIRFAELSSERCAAVFCEGNAVKWVVASPTFTRGIERGTRLDPQSAAHDFFATGRLDERAQPVPASAWFATSRDVDIIEHSIAHTALGTTLTMLWVPDAVAPRLGMA